MGASIIPVPDEEEFQAWKAQQAAARQMPQTEDDAEFQQWKQQRAKRSGGIDLRQPAESTRVERNRTPSPSKTNARYLTGVLAKAATGALPFADELAGVLGGAAESVQNAVTGKPVNFSESRKRIQDETRKQLAEFGEEAPVASTLAQVGGAFIPAVATGGTTLAGRLGLTGIKGALTTGAENAAIGALYGAGENDENRAAGATIGGLTGGTLGALIGTAERALGRTSGAATSAAKSRVLGALKKDGKSITDLRAISQEAPKAPVSITDVGGEEVQDALRSVLSTPSSKRRAVMNAIESRKMTQPKRVIAALEDAAKTSGDDFYEVADALIARQAQKSQPLYETFEASGALEGNETFNRLMASPIIRNAMKQARALPQYKDLSDLDPALLNKVYKNIGGKVQKASRQGDKTLARDYRQVRNLLKDAIAEQRPIFRSALDVFSGEAELQDALATGTKALRMDPREIARTLKDLSASEQQLFRKGAVDRIRQMVDDAPDKANVVNRIFGSQSKKDRIRALFPDADSYRQFESAMRAETSIGQAGPRISRMKPTRRPQDLGPGQLGRFGGDILSPNPITAIWGTAGNKAKQLLRGDIGATADETARILTGVNAAGDFQSLRQIIDELASGKRYQRDPRLMRFGSTLGSLLMNQGVDR